MKRNQNDGAANETLGRRYASLDDWGRAIPRLAKADDDALRTAAANDMLAQKDPTKQVLAADGWWNVAEGAEGKEERAYRARAVYWYTFALPSLTGLLKTRAEKRIEEAGKVDLSGQTVGDDSKQTILLAPGVPLVLVKIPASADGKIREFWLGQTEVTQRQWSALMAENPSEHRGEDLPVERVAGAECLSFAAKATEAAKRFVFRLPTAVEFRHVFSPGEQYGPDYQAASWTPLNADGPHPVGRLRPNRFGVCDILGNVWERVDDGATALGGAFDNKPNASELAKGPIVEEIGKDLRLGNTGFRVAADLR